MLLTSVDLALDFEKDSALCAIVRELDHDLLGVEVLV